MCAFETFSAQTQGCRTRLLPGASTLRIPIGCLLSQQCLLCLEEWKRETGARSQEYSCRVKPGWLGLEKLPGRGSLPGGWNSGCPLSYPPISSDCLPRGQAPQLWAALCSCVRGSSTQGHHQWWFLENSSTGQQKQPQVCWKPKKTGGSPARQGVCPGTSSLPLPSCSPFSHSATSWASRRWHCLC